MTCPKTPASDRPGDLGFERRPMVPWFHPLELIDAGVVSAVSSVFGTYADRREMQAALRPPSVVTEFTDKPELWIDYAADLGDGFNSTYAVAQRLAEPNLTIKAPSGTAHTTRRGALLVLGGDQVYPTAGAVPYQNRFVGPYTAALPCVVDGEPPRLFAIPGNHDWYDGLTSFLRLFCQGRWIGGWKTSQERSYFAIRLPHRWWLWGIDIQLHEDIDEPQLDYFRRVATGTVAGGEPNERYLEGQRIILCTAVPSWVHATRDAPGAYQNLDYFERKIITRHGGRLAATLTGDIHHYARYASGAGTHKITAGGGGAYLAGTHNLPRELVLGERREEYRLSEPTFPAIAKSKGLAARALRFPFMPMNWQFTGFLAVLYMLYAWTVQSAAKKLGANLLEWFSSLSLSGAGLRHALYAWGAVLAHTPAAVVFTLAIVVGLGAFASGGRPLVNWLVGLSHGVAHILLAIALSWSAAAVNVRLLHLPVDSLGQVLLFIGWVLLVGGPLGGLLMAVYFVMSNRLLGMHANEVFVTQAIQDYKCFLRLHIDGDGTLTIFPIGLREVPKKWRFNAAARDGEPWFEPAESGSAPELIEDPIRIGGPSA